MNRRELLKRAAIVPLAAAGAALVTEPAEAAVGQIGIVTDIYPGGYGPESFNGGDIVVKIDVLSAEGVKVHEIFGLVHKKTDIFFQGDKVKYREFKDEVYYNHAALLAALLGIQAILLFKANNPYGKLKSIDFNTPL